MCLALNDTSLTVSLVGLSKSVSGGGRELISLELYCRWAHVQLLARCAGAGGHNGEQRPQATASGIL